MAGGTSLSEDSWDSDGPTAGSGRGTPVASVVVEVEDIVGSGVPVVEGQPTRIKTKAIQHLSKAEESLQKALQDIHEKQKDLELSARSLEWLDDE